MSRRYLRFWPVPAALAVCGIVATCAGTASTWARGSKNLRVSSSPATAVAATTPTRPAAKAAPAAPPAAAAPVTAERRRANLVFVVDASPRMNAPTKLPLVQRTMLETVEFLDARDRVAIVTYGREARVLLPSTPVSNRTAIIQVINGLSAEPAGAAGASGMELAYAQASRAFVTGGINHVLLCTDENWKAHDAGAFARLVRENRRAGVTLTVLGYGTGALERDTAARLGEAGASVPAPIGDDGQMHRYVRERLLSASDDGAPPRM
jgi:Mg-chelatase subunit ChlD